MILWNYIFLLKSATKWWLYNKSLITIVFFFFSSFSHLCVLMLHFSWNGLPSLLPAGHFMAWTTSMAGSQRQSADSSGTILTYLNPVKTGGPVSHFPVQWGSMDFLSISWSQNNQSVTDLGSVWLWVSCGPLMRLQVSPASMPHLCITNILIVTKDNDSWQIIAWVEILPSLSWQSLHENEGESRTKVW